MPKLVAIASATDQLIRLAEDLLFLARTDARSDNSGTGVEIYAFRHSCAGGGRSLKLKGNYCTSNLLAGITVNGERLNWHLFSNLVENALKYTPKGEVLLCMTKHQQFGCPSGGHWDGNCSEHLPLIFQRFWRADSSGATHRGFRIGISYCP